MISFFIIAILSLFSLQVLATDFTTQLVSQDGTDIKINYQSSEEIVEARNISFYAMIKNVIIVPTNFKQSDQIELEWTHQCDYYYGKLEAKIHCSGKMNNLVLNIDPHDCTWSGEPQSINYLAKRWPQLMFESHAYSGFGEICHEGLSVSINNQLLTDNFDNTLFSFSFQKPQPEN